MFIPFDGTFLHFADDHESQYKNEKDQIGKYFENVQMNIDSGFSQENEGVLKIRENVIEI